MEIKIKPTAFDGIAEAERQSVLGYASYDFFGLKMQQHPQAVVKLNQLLNAIEPARIIEIGSGDCGLSYLFAIYAHCKSISFHSYDIVDSGKHREMLVRHFGAFSKNDVIENAENTRGVAAMVAMPGRTLLICDAGKALEFNIYADHLKIGDFVLTHDFAPTPEEFRDKIQGRVWNWHENWYARIAEACAKNNIVHSPWMNDVVWSCGWRESQ